MKMCKKQKPFTNYSDNNYNKRPNIGQILSLHLNSSLIRDDIVMLTESR